MCFFPIVGVVEECHEVVGREERLHGGGNACFYGIGEGIGDFFLDGIDHFVARRVRGRVISRVRVGDTGGRVRARARGRVISRVRAFDVGGIGRLVNFDIGSSCAGFWRRGDWWVGCVAVGFAALGKFPCFTVIVGIGKGR